MPIIGTKLHKKSQQKKQQRLSMKLLWKIYAENKGHELNAWEFLQLVEAQMKPLKP